MRRSARASFYGVAAAVVALDQLTKALVLAFLPRHDVIPVVEGVFNLVHVRNPGAAFSLFADLPAWFREPFFVTITLVAVVVLVFVSERLGPEERLTRLAMGGVLGGAVGNLVDRLRYGEVIDFLDVYWGDLHWPAFNVADASITIAVVAVLLQSVFAGKEPSPRNVGDSPGKTPGA